MPIVATENSLNANKTKQKIVQMPINQTKQS